MELLHYAFGAIFVSYFLALNLAYTLLLALGSGQVTDWVRRRRCATSAASATRRCRCR